MNRHRFRELVEQQSWALRPQQPAFQAGAFFLCPAAFLLGCGVQGSWQLHVYQAAFEHAQAVARPSLLERDLLACWN